MNSITNSLSSRSWALLVVFMISSMFYSCSVRNESDNTKPEDSRFTTIELVKGILDEPVKMRILPDGKVLIIERKGALKSYNPTDSTIKTIATFPVFDGLEDGLLGFALDPSFEENGWMYFFYSPKGDDSIQRVSRFKYENDALIQSSEKVIIEIPLQRIECCHSAGSLEFGPDRSLYISLGDNTNPHNPGYYNSIDERPGREYWDAQRTAANTDDLRGKILRVRIEEDGSYTIPDGNLFPKDGSGGRPEIYAMGTRNPYKIAVDPINGWLMWGDVGQNTVDDPSRGPISYDEWNLTNEPGFFGWPYFAGPNAPYTHFDFETEENGEFYDVDSPMNRSPNNTGAVQLPPAKSALIWYSYDESKEFPHLGTGGKSPIAGPIYHYDSYPAKASATSPKFPKYYDGKWFIAEWIRDWINVLTVDKDGKLVSIEPFLPNEPFHHPIDIEFGPDGAMYVLDYGSNWFAQNADSRLVKIEYEGGNRKPVVSLKSDVQAGSIPLKVKFSSEGTFDYDKDDNLTYSWNFGEGVPSSTEADPEVTFNEPRSYTVTLVVSDGKGAEVSKTMEIDVGNAVPTMDLDIVGNRSFYWDKREINYQLKVEDKEDGSLSSGIESKLVKFQSVYGRLPGEAESGANTSAGMELILNSDCRSCHSMTELSVGPSYTSIAQRYKGGDEKVVEGLAEKIISGGSGVWGGYVMSAHPQIPLDQAKIIVNYILSLSDVKITNLPVGGKYIFSSHASETKEDENYVFKAEYTDRGNPPAKSLTKESTWIFRPLRLKASSGDGYSESKLNYQTGSVRFNKDKAYALFNNIDLSGIKNIALEIDSVNAFGKLEIRKNKPDGELIGEVTVDKVQEGKPWLKNVDLGNRTDVGNLYFIYRQVGTQSLEDGSFILNRIIFNR